MDVLVKRKYKKSSYTVGDLYIDGVWFCSTLEDLDRGLYQNMALEEIKMLKVYGETAIPAGKYLIRMDIVSNKYSKVEWYWENCGGGRMPRVEDVKGFEGVLLHPGNTALDSYGCILVGLNKKKGQLVESKKTFKKLWNKLEKAHKQEEAIWLTIS